MTYTPFPIDHFAGLDLFTDPLEVGVNGCLDALDIDPRDPTRLVTRPGLTQMSNETATGVSQLGILAPFDDGTTRQYIVNYFDSIGGTPVYGARNAVTGATIASTTTPAGNFTSWATFGTPSATITLLGSGSELWKYDGSVFAKIAGAPFVQAIGILPTSNRAVLGGDSTLNMSAAGDGTSYPGYTLQVTPGDGEHIWCMANFNNDLYVFKETKFFVLSGESQTSVGTPLFPYRSVVGHGGSTCAAGERGVYFYDGASVWLTTGGIPGRISQPIENFLRGNTTLGGFSVAQPSALQLYSSLGRIFLSGPDEGMTLVFDEVAGQWSCWSVPVFGCLTLHGGSVVHPPTYTYIATGKKTSRFDSTTDYGASISGHWTSGKYLIGDGDRAVAREVRVWGTGAANLTSTADGIDTALTGTIATAPLRLRTAQRGNVWQMTVRVTSTSSVSRIAQYVRDVETPK